MSRYISTFLYEPIARQARRFSSPTTAETAEQREARHGTLMDERTSSSVAAQEEEVPVLNVNDTQPIASISGQPVMLSPTNEDGWLEAQLQGLRYEEAFEGSWNTNTTAAPDPNMATLRIDSISEGLLAQAGNDVIHNPTRRLTDRFRSANTSISSSINETGLTHSQSPRRSRANTIQDSTGPAANSYIVDGILPEDDGMRAVRNKIHEIQNQSASNHEKSRLMHELMAQQYSSHHPNLLLHNNSQARSPRNQQSQDIPVTPNSHISIIDMTQSSLPRNSTSSVADHENICQVTSEDLKPTYWVPPIPSATANNSNESIVPDQMQHSRAQDDHNDQESPLGCAHYKRNVKLQCSACFRWYTCRFCHDGIEDHSLNRRETKNMLCMLCGCAQPVAGGCQDCHESSARYYCGICKLWDDDPNKSIYHCSDCGICRIGEGLGRDFYHCKVGLDLSVTFS